MVMPYTVDLADVQNVNPRQTLNCQRSSFSIKAINSGSAEEKDKILLKFGPSTTSRNVNVIVPPKIRRKLRSFDPCPSIFDRRAV